MINVDKYHADVKINNLFIRGAAFLPIEGIRLTPRLDGNEIAEKLVWIEINTGSGQMAIGQSAGLVDRLLDDQTRIATQDCSASMWSAVLSETLSDWLASLESVSNTDVTLSYIEGYSVNDASDVIVINLDVFMPNGQQEILSLCCENSVKHILVEFLSKDLKRQHYDHSELEIPLPVSMTIGSTTVAAKDAWRLELGDVVLIDSVFSREHIEVMVRIGSRHFLRGSFNQSGQISIVSNPGEIELEKVADIESGVGVRMGSQISIKLEFDIGETELSYSELSDLKEGYVFDLGKQLSTGVTIRSGWHVVGRGELVDIGGGRLGVRLTDCNTILNAKD